MDEYKKIINKLSKLNNENIIKYYNILSERDTFSIIMEYAGDYNLKQFIAYYKQKSQLINQNLIHDIIIQICLGLKEIHENFIIHRDLTPDNIFIDEENYKVKIGDFGISKILYENQYTRSRKGKYHYFAPEIEKGEKQTNKVDIYSLGCIIYELFTLNEYYIDKIIEQKECKINTDIYNPQYQELIDLLLKRDYNERPNIREVINLIKKEIILVAKIDEVDIGKKIYFLTEQENVYNSVGNSYYDPLKEINESNSEIFINENKIEFERYFIPKIEGLFSIKIKFAFNFKITDCGYIFKGCKNLVSIDLSSFPTQNVTNMERMFSYCSNLKSIDFSSFDTNNVINMEGMFYKCENLENLDLSSFDSRNVIYMEQMFYGCKNLNNIKLSTNKTQNLRKY